MKTYSGLVYILNPPPLYLKNGAKVIIDEQIKTVSHVAGYGDSHLAYEYYMNDDDKAYNYNDLWILVVQPVLPMGRDLRVWFYKGLIRIAQDTKTNYGCLLKESSGGEKGFEYVTKTSLCMYIIPQHWGEALKYVKGVDKIKFNVYENYENQIVPEYNNSNATGFHAKLV